MPVPYLPAWDGHQGWDRRPISVKIEDLAEFKRGNRVRVLRSRWMDGAGDPVLEVVTDDNLRARD
jgi:hypothetical protein